MTTGRARRQWGTVTSHVRQASLRWRDSGGAGGNGGGNGGCRMTELPTGSGGLHGPGEPDLRPPLSEVEFHEIYTRVPRLTVEVVIECFQGILLTKRATGSCSGLWHLPGGTVRFAEPLESAVRRVAFAEVGLEVDVGRFLGYIEYPSHYGSGLDSPVGLAFLCSIDDDQTLSSSPASGWFTVLPEPMHTEQVDFLVGHDLIGPAT